MRKECTRRKSLLIFLIIIFTMNFIKDTNGRYLPTRSHDDGLDRLRDLLRDVSVYSSRQKQKKKILILNNRLDSGKWYRVSQW